MIHVVDFSHPLYHDQMDVVNKTLSDLGAGDKPQIVVYNKIDNVKPNEGEEFEGSEEEYFESRRLMNNSKNNVIYISALKKSNIDQLRKIILKDVKKQHLKIYPNYIEPNIY